MTLATNKIVSQSGDGAAAAGSPARRHARAPWHCLYFLPDPQGQGSFRPTFAQLAASSALRCLEAGTTGPVSGTTVAGFDSSTGSDASWINLGSSSYMCR